MDQIKFKANVPIKHYKAWLVAKGYTKKEEIDYLVTISLNAKIVTFKSY